jgi:hypothetical protein
MINITRFALLAQSTEVPLDRDLAASFKMNGRCFPKIGVVRQRKIEI